MYPPLQQPFRNHSFTKSPRKPLTLIPSRCEPDWGNKHKKSHKITSAEQNHVWRDTQDTDTQLTQVSTQGTMGNQEPSIRAGPTFETPGKNIRAPKSYRHPGQHLPNSSPGCSFQSFPLTISPISPVLGAHRCPLTWQWCQNLYPALLTCKTLQLQDTEPEGTTDTSKFTTKSSWNPGSNAMGWNPLWNLSLSVLWWDLGGF